MEYSTDVYEGANNESNFNEYVDFADLVMVQ